MARYSITGLTLPDRGCTILEAPTKSAAVRVYRDAYHPDWTLTTTAKAIVCERIKEPKVAKVSKLTCAICANVVGRKEYVDHVRSHQKYA